jgi:CDP-paratose 2-epimerase
MSVALITGSAGLVGASSARIFASKGLAIVGVDNDMRRVFFGDQASTAWSRERLERDIPGYVHFSDDIRDRDAMKRIFSRYGRNISVVIHAAAQPSHDWAARDPQLDFSVNANGTLNLLEMTRTHCDDAVFIFVSTNKVYGDTPNRLPLEELETRWELPESHPYGRHGIDETMSIDQNLHSLFGVSKAAADLLVQEFGRYFGMKTGIFRGGCLTGPDHAGAELHGFLAYLVKCAITGERYTVFGYGGKQVRDNIHAEDLVEAFWHFYQRPRVGEVYNIGGSRHSNCSMLEAIRMAEDLTGRPMNWGYEESNRVGDHIWWISDVRKFQEHYAGWSYRYGIAEIMREIHAASSERYAG